MNHSETSDFQEILSYNNRMTEYRFRYEQAKNRFDDILSVNLFMTAIVLIYHLLILSVWASVKKLPE